MNKNTIIRLHMPKSLLESLTKQILAEAKKGDMSGGAYTEAVKVPKAEKSSKAAKPADLEETKDSGEYKVGDKVTYLGHPAEITKVHKDVMGRTQYSLYYDKGNGRTKVSNIMSNDDSIKPVKEVAKKQHSLEELMKVKEKIEKKIMEMESSSKKADDSKHMK